MKKYILMLAVALAGAVTFADVAASFDITGSNLSDMNNVLVDDQIGLFYLIADVNGDGLNGYATAGVDNDLDFVSTFVASGSDDVLFATGSFYPGFDGFALTDTEGQTYLGVTTGDEYYAVYSDGTGWAGVYRADNANWLIPNANGSLAAAFDGIDNAGDISKYQAVPEPATALLAFIGAGLAYAVRRRGHKFVS